MADPSPADRLEIRVRGTVQGVGFRPFVYRLATDLQVAGRVYNTSEGVTIEAEGAGSRLTSFLRRLELEPPPAARIRAVEVRPVKPLGERTFRIDASTPHGQRLSRICPDLATCTDCLRELLDPADRRYRYPFLNCTRCGPRYSILEHLPYDRPHTTLRDFPLCARCLAEYEDPGDRRFHAQPIACPDCGPHLELWDREGQVVSTHDDALRQAAEAIRHGQVVAVKGLGGFHLMVAAENDEAVHELRHRKAREEKPFALMFGSMDSVSEACLVSPAEAALLSAPEAPIVLLRRRPGYDGVAAAVAPGSPLLGVMLPYTPLHHLLVLEVGGPVVATSGNRSDEPICADEREALSRLGDIADLFLVHDRPIARPLDDSLVRVVQDRPLVLRCARGLAPVYLELPWEAPPLLAVGGHLKCAVAVTAGSELILGPHIGDLETPLAIDAFEQAITRLERLAGAAGVVCDAHPDYRSSRYAERLGRPLTRVFHHEAHVRAAMLDLGIEGEVLGVAWDGSGLGPDGSVWGGEFLRIDRLRVDRVAWLRPFPLPGGDRAAREPRRSALGLLYAMAGPRVLELTHLPPLRTFTRGELQVMIEAMDRAVNAPRTSSVGRLFDGIASLLDLRHRSTFEGQAAMALEHAALTSFNPDMRSYPVTVEKTGMIDWRPLVEAVLEAAMRLHPVPEIAARFHLTLARLVVDVAGRTGANQVLLTGGCFQNAVLLETTVRELEAAGIRPLWPRRIPPNDGGLAVGQAARRLAELLEVERSH